MGMYDSAIMTLKCPECGKEGDYECQTKDLNRVLEVWRPGDFVAHGINGIDCISACDNCDCFFNLTINIREGLLTSEYEIVENWNHRNPFKK
jgi:hypothetical protein